MKRSVTNYFDLKKNNRNFSSFVLRKSLPLNTLVFFVFYLLLSFFSGIPVFKFSNQIFPMMLIFFIEMTTTEYILHSLTTTKLSNSIIHWESTGMNTASRTELLETILHYPFKRSMVTMAIYILNNLLLTFYLKCRFHVDNHILSFIFLGVLHLCYLKSMLDIYHLEVACGNVASKIVKSGIKISQGQRFFGISTNTSYIIFIILPVIFSGLIILFSQYLSFTEIIIHPNGEVASLKLSELEMKGIFIKGLLPSEISQLRLIFHTLSNISIILVLIFLYYSKITKHIDTMQKNLEKKGSNYTGKTSFFDVDLSTENSYSLHMLNNEFLFFDRLIESNIQYSFEIRDSIKNLSNISTETEGIVSTQSVQIENILAIMQNIDTMSKQTETKISEVTNIISDSLGNISSMSNKLGVILEQMKNITEINGVTISNIKNFTDKLLSIQDILSIIENIADQTKTIAFNSELEANTTTTEHNNENFTLIAEQIRELTKNTIDLTKKIKEQIREISSSSELLINTGNNCMKKTQEGNAICSTLDSKFSKIIDFANESYSSSEKIKDTIHEQGNSFREIIITIEQLMEDFRKFKDSSKNRLEIIARLRDHSQKILEISEEYKKRGNEA